jgi:hypothetical protein
MSVQNSAQKTIAQIVRNDEQLFPGDLKHYLRVTVQHARNLNNPYHNFRHLFHVLYMVHQACWFHRSDLLPREIRNMHIAAIFHDFDHSGRTGHDDLEIARAVRALNRYIHEDDALAYPHIAKLIEATQFPYRTPSQHLSLDAQILRDADMSQVFHTAWLQQILFGLGAEMNMTPVQMLAAQPAFLETLSFSTPWAHATFPPSLIREKINESRELLALLQDA